MWKKVAGRADLENNWCSKGTHINKDDIVRWVKNYSDRNLSEAEVSVLAKGLNFAVTPTQIPVVDVVTTMETAIHGAKSRTYRCDGDNGIDTGQRSAPFSRAELHARIM